MITKDVVSIFLDVDRPNQMINEHFLQGSVSKDLKISILKGNVLQVLETTLKPIINFVYPNGLKFVIAPTMPDGSVNNNYNITVADNTILIPANIAMTDISGSLKLIVEIANGGTFYTYSGNYLVDENPAYTSKIVAELPTWENKANKDLSNVVGFAAASEGDMFYKKNNALVKAPLRIDDTAKKLISDYDLQIPPKSIYFGLNTSMHENGGYLEYHTETLGKNYLLLDYENDPITGSKRPVVGERGVKEIKTEDQAVITTPMNNLSVINFGTPAYDRQIQRVYFNFINAVTNFKFALEVNGKIVADYPTNSWNNPNVAGYNLDSGVQQVDLNPFWTELTSYNIRVLMSANSPINMLGNGTLPYLAFDLNRITMKEVAYKGEGDGGATTLLGLTDTPDSYAGKAGYLVRIKNSEDGIEFDLPPDFALPDLSNVKAENLKKKSVNAGMLQQDLEDVDLTKLKEKVDAAKANLITVGELHGDYHQGDVKEIQMHNGLDVTIDTQTKVASISLSEDMKALPDEVARIKTNLAADDTVFSYRGTKAPNYSGGPYKQYYVNITNASGGFTMKLPVDAPVNAIFTIRNSDKTNPFVLSVDAGTINNGANTYNIQENGLALFIKNSANNWNAIYGGYMANNLRQLVDLIKAQLPPNSGLTIDQIQAQLKDRLHLFSEIQTEFNDELHTFDAIEANMVTRGFSKGFSVGYGMLDTDTPPLDTSWVVAFINPSSEVIIPSTNKGMKYLAVYMPTFLASVVDSLTINGTETEFTESDVVQNENYYKVLIAKTQVDTSTNTRLKLEFKPSQIVNEITFLDGLKGTEFMASKIKSTDKSIRISELNDGYADLSKGYSDHNEGIHVCLGNDELLNSKYGKSKLYFSDTRVKGGMFVYPDTDTKSFILQDIDPQDDPNISGGTTFIIALYYEPNPDEENKVTQDGQIAIELVDDNDIPITGTDGNPMGAVIDYKANDIVKPELYIGECQATAFTRVHLKIDLRFANEEIISVGANTQLCIQSINKDESSGLALLSFMAFTGYQIAFDTKYYGYNSLNMAQFLTFDTPEINTNAQQLSFGNNTYLDFKNNSKLSITNNHLTIKDDGVNLPIWTIVNIYGKLDSHSIGGKSYKVTATLTDKDDAYRVSLMEYTGNANPVPLPTVLRYDNQNPVFTAGWVQRDSMFISEDAVSGDHTQSQTFIMPVNAKSLAIIMYHVESQIPVNLSLKDLEGDITPWFNKVIITDNSHISEKYLSSKDGVYRGITKTPSGDISYRYTVNSADTKIPVGVVSGDDGNVVNDNSWHDPGSIDPNKVQGDLKFLVDGKVTISYTARCFNEQGSLNNIEFWLAKNVGGVFTEVANSRTATTIEAQRTQPKMVSSFKFSFDVKANETYRMFAKSNKDDGFYLQSNLDGVPLFRLDIEFDEFAAAEKAVSDRITYLESHADEVIFVKAGVPVTDPTRYKLQIDVDTGRTSIKNV